MSAIAQCLSHSPVAYARPLEASRQSMFDAALRDARSAMDSFKPDAVVMFGPDHYNGVFYNMMPPICVGAQAVGIGDYGTLKGALPVDSSAAEALHMALLAADFDVAISHDLHMDHGFTQSLQQLFGDPPPFIPIFINCAAQPVARCARIIALGRKIGEIFKARGGRVAFLGSGGLSHDAPLPSMATTPPGPARRKLIEWRMLEPAERAERETRTLEAADKFAAGDSPLAPLNGRWDREIMDLIGRGEWNRLAELKDEDITRLGGRSGHEIRTWLAAFAALSVFGPYQIEQSAYFEAPEWIVGFGALRGRAVAAS